MVMAKFTVDGPNLLLIAQAGVVDVDVQVDLYSDAKEHWLTTPDNKFEFPFRTIAGDPIRAGVLFGDGYFIQNGWKIRPDEVSHTLTIAGNLFLDVGETPGIIVPTLGAFTVLVEIERSTDPRFLSAPALELLRKIFLNRAETTVNPGPSPPANSKTIDFYDDDQLTIIESLLISADGNTRQNP